MDSNYRYSLDKSSKKFVCPGCSKQTFVRYKDYSTGEYLANEIGRCDREDNCGYHVTPRSYFAKHPNLKPLLNNWNPKPIKAKPITIIPDRWLDESLSKYSENYFVQWLNALFDSSIANRLVDQFKIGTSKHWKGATAFWQIDIERKVRQVKIMLYNPNTGKRLKGGDLPFKGKSKIFFAGKLIMRQEGIKDANLCQCFFGEHQLLDYPNKKIAIVESEKTAIVMSAILPDLIWIATGGKNGAKWTTEKVYKALKGREVILFPDLGAFEYWQERAKILKTVCNYEVSELLQRKASKSDIKKGYDIADYFIKSIQTKEKASTPNKSIKNFNRMEKQMCLNLIFGDGYISRKHHSLSNRIGELQTMGFVFPSNVIQVLEERGWIKQMKGNFSNIHYERR